MIHTIQNNYLLVSVQHTGAEICSIKSLKTQQEFMWNANPDFWGSYAPVLFPIIGCLKDGTYTYKGKEYSITKHGFIRNNNQLEVQDKTDTSLTLKLQYNKETLKMFPFKFAFLITFRLNKNSLQVIHKVENLGEEEMYFSLGGHPAFKCPTKEGEQYADYYLEFEETETEETVCISAEGLVNGETAPMLNNTNALPLTDNLFDNDALIFKKLKSHKVSLKSQNHKTALTVSFPDFDYLGIWAKPKAPFVCIEPWLGITDHASTDGNFKNKDGVILLNDKATFEAKYDIIIDEE